ncbi:MAG TPA: MCE family protein [Mycobacteriales bacterium]|nr:MCE family protein [Mycobacteriales bacterium]
MTARPRARRVLTTAVAGGTSAVLLAGCGFDGARSIPLPGGEGAGADAYRVTVEFEDVLDLVPQSAVKVDDVTVGSVDSIELDGYTARVVTRINPDVEIPANATASLRQTSLLGEKFVSFDRPPTGQERGRLRGGETIGLDRTQRSAEIEEVLSAFSLFLNGGSIEQIQVINTELINALEGREDDVKNFLQQLEVFVAGLDDQKGEIVRALDSLDRLTARLVDERQVIATALDDIPPGVAVLTGQRENITRMLTALDQLSDVAVRTIEASRVNTRASLEALRPILQQLNAAGADFPNSLELLTTYPFPRSIDQGIKGDYANLFVTLDLDVRQIIDAECGGTPAEPLCNAIPDLGGQGEAAEEQPAEQQQSQQPPPPLLPPAVPGAPALPLPVVPDQVVKAPPSSGLSGFFDRIRPNGSSNGGGILGLLIGGLK